MKLLGELGLDGSIAAVAGVLPAVIGANARDEGLICPAACGAEAAWASPDIQIVAANSLIQIANHFKGSRPLAPSSRNSLTTAIWPSRWSRLPPFPAATIRGVLPFASGPSTLAHGPAKTAPRGFARRRYLQTAFAGWGRSSLSRRRYSRAFGSGPALKKIAQRSEVSRCDGRAEIVGRGLLSRGASRAHTNLRLFHIIYTT
jgi:hypothetical protein